ncbi:MAG: hypothetical protein U1C33_05085 [Candidatus Cloacimonadaceae bacterium]|nr:hypothetical protein [Candidatus Cloacimonadaceae bacterium]
MKLIVILALLVILIGLTACAPGSPKFAEGRRPANFLAGIWHGWIAPVCLIWQLFDPSIRIYEVNNTGWAYDLGYYIAIIGGFGGFALSRSKSKSD